MADENSTVYLRELRLIRIALYLIALLLAMIACVLALNGWAESTRPPRTAANEMRSGLWAQRARDVGPIDSPRKAHPREPASVASQTKRCTCPGPHQGLSEHNGLSVPSPALAEGERSSSEPHFAHFGAAVAFLLDTLSPLK